MHKTFLPQSRVPGASPKMNTAIIPQQLRDLKGLPVWNMPESIRFEEHKGVKRDKRTGKTYRTPIQVPIYRAMAAFDVRYLKSQYFRTKRKEGELTDKPEFTGTSRMIRRQKFLKMLDGIMGNTLEEFENA